MVLRRASLCRQEDLPGIFQLVARDVSRYRGEEALGQLGLQRNDLKMMTT
ncbi:hypothetical protein ABIB48_001000 [Arthrobacter sp. UYCu511]